MKKLLTLFIAMQMLVVQAAFAGNSSLQNRQEVGDIVDRMINTYKGNPDPEAQLAAFTVLAHEMNNTDLQVLLERISTAQIQTAKDIEALQAKLENPETTLDDVAKGIGVVSYAVSILSGAVVASTVFYNIMDGGLKQAGEVAMTNSTFHSFVAVTGIFIAVGTGAYLVDSYFLAPTRNAKINSNEKIATEINKVKLELRRLKLTNQTLNLQIQSARLLLRQETLPANP